MPGTDYLDEIDVGAFGEAFVVADPASASDDVHGFEVVREFDVGNARIEEPVSVAPVDPFDVDHSQLHGASQPVDTKHPGFVDAIRRVEPLDVAADAQVMGKQGEAAARCRTSRPASRRRCSSASNSRSRIRRKRRASSDRRLRYRNGGRTDGRISALWGVAPPFRRSSRMKSLPAPSYFANRICICSEISALSLFRFGGRSRSALLLHPENACMSGTEEVFLGRCKIGSNQL